MGASFLLVQEQNLYHNRAYLVLEKNLSSSTNFKFEMDFTVAFLSWELLQGFSISPLNFVNRQALSFATSFKYVIKIDGTESSLISLYN